MPALPMYQLPQRHSAPERVLTGSGAVRVRRSSARLGHGISPHDYYAHSDAIGTVASPRSTRRCLLHRSSAEHGRGLRRPVTVHVEGITAIQKRLAEGFSYGLGRGILLGTANGRTEINV